MNYVMRNQFRIALLHATQVRRRQLGGAALQNLPHLKCPEVVLHMQRLFVANGDPKYWSFAGKKRMTQDEPDGRLLVGTKWGKERLVALCVQVVDRRWPCNCHGESGT
jgi:hypothetical protein